jgi:hypothetical protein
MANREQNQMGVMNEQSTALSLLALLNLRAILIIRPSGGPVI